jgi:aspartate-semialdehyde dehydrogenase
MHQKIRAGILGATGTVGQKFVTLLAEHPWFEVACVAASNRSSGRTYKEAVSGRWTQTGPVPEKTGTLPVFEVESDMLRIAEEADFVFSALSMEKSRIREIESAFAEKGLPVISNNSAHRMTCRS